MRFQQGMREEDHLAAIICNAMFLIHYEEMIERGILPASLNDMPAYNREVWLTKNPKAAAAIKHGLSQARKLFKKTRKPAKRKQRKA